MENDINVNIDAIFKMDEFDGDLIVGNASMKKWNTTISLTEEGSVVKLGNISLKIMNIIHRKTMFSKSKMTEIMKDPGTFLANDKQSTPYSEIFISSCDKNQATNTSVFHMLQEKEWAMTAIQEIERKEILEQNASMKGAIVKGSYIV